MRPVNRHVVHHATIRVDRTSASRRLDARYSHDNSAGNPQNPNRPPTRVVYGPESSGEMGDLWLRLLPRTAADAEVLARGYLGKTGSTKGGPRST